VAGAKCEAATSLIWKEVAMDNTAHSFETDHRGTVPGGKLEGAVSLKRQSVYSALVLYRNDLPLDQIMPKPGGTAPTTIS
jgi:hypothetical protein